jgi:hypothetical protein
VEVTLRVEHADLGSLERAVAGALDEVGRILWQHLLSWLEAALPAPLRCPSCGGGPPKANGRAPRSVATLAGEVALRRRRFRCRSCGTETVPLDAALGLAAREGHSLGVRERALLLVTEFPYARSADLLGELCRIGVSHGQLHAWVAEEGGRLDALREATRRSIFEAGEGPAAGRDGQGTVWVSVDGTMVNDRADGSCFEVKAGLVWEGTRCVSRGRRALEKRFWDGATGSWTAFAERFTAACAARGVYEAETIYFVSDGHPAIAYIRDHAFPTAIELLDWYHLENALRAGLGAERPEHLGRALAAARQGDVDGLLAALADAADGADEEAGLKLTRAAGYVAANRQGIENYALVPLASSGPTEKAVDIIVCRRFKGRGMSWGRRGVSHLLALRLLRLNGGWRDYWRERFEASRRPWPRAA